MSHLAAGFLLAGICVTAAAAQGPPGLPNPDLQYRIPAPLPPPPPRPIIKARWDKALHPLLCERQLTRRAFPKCAPAHAAACVIRAR
jgi:hypothetical protein